MMNPQPIRIDPDLMLEVGSDEAKRYIAGNAIALCADAHLPARRNNAVLRHLTTRLYHETRHCFWLRYDADHGALIGLCKQAITLALADHDSPYQQPSH